MLATCFYASLPLTNCTVDGRDAVCSSPSLPELHHKLAKFRSLLLYCDCRCATVALTASMETDVNEVMKFSNLEQVASWIGHTNSIICLQEMSIDLISRANSALMDHRTTMTITEDVKNSWLVACNFCDAGKKRLCELCCSADGNLLLIFVDRDMESMLNELVGIMKDDIANSVVISTANTRNSVDSVCPRFKKLFHQLSESVGEFWMLIVDEAYSKKWSTSPDLHPLKDEGSFWVAHSTAATLKGNANKVHLLVDPLGEGQNYPATKIHRALYFINELNDANKLSHHLNVAEQFSIDGIVNMPLFKNAIHTMLSEQVGLLLTFPINNSNCLCQEYSGATVNSFHMAMHVSHSLPGMQRIFDIKHCLLLKPPIQICVICESLSSMHLLLNIHHMLTDGFSLAVILSSIVHTYNKSICNKDSDFSMRLHSLEQIACPDQFDDDSTEAHMEYWKRIESHEGLHFHDRDSGGALHTNKYVKKTVVLLLGVLHSSALDDLCTRFIKTDHVSRFSLQFCALACSLQQRTGESHVVIGYLSGLKNRDRTMLKNAVSCQAHILIVRAILSNLFSVRQYISTQSKYLYDARTKGFGQSFNSTQFDSPAAILSLMQVVMNVWPININPDEQPIGGTTHEEFMRTGGVNFDLSLTFCPKKRPPSLIIDYNNTVLTRFSTLNIAIICSTYLTLFTKSIGQDLLQIFDSYSDNKPKRNFTTNGQSTNAEQPANSLSKLIQGQCQNAKSSDLAHSRNSSISYTFAHQSLRWCGISVAQANQQTNCCWTYEAMIGIRMNEGIRFLNAMLATVYVGGCYMPLDPGAPVARNNVILQSTQPRAILRADSVDKERSVSITTDRVHKSRGWRIVQCHSDLLCILHTSGTTGIPKGVALTQRGVIGVPFCEVARTRSFNFAIKLLQSANFLFDLSVFDIYLSLFNGACIVFAEDRLQICKELSKCKLECACITTPLFNNFTRSEYLMISNAQTIIVGGDKLTAQTARYSSRNGISVWNVYGPTEITMFCTSHFVKRNTKENTIGIPIQCYELTVLNNYYIPSVIGQLFVKSAVSARGYFHQPHLTDRSFLDAPSVKQSMSIYGTGDTVVQTNDSYFHFVGRKAFQIKLRGYRIELGEIESTIAKHSLVHSCVALPISRSADSSNSDGDISLVAFIVPKSNNNCTRPLVSSVSKTCQNYLPDYMIPSEYIVVASIPFTFNGKINRRELEAIYREHCTMRCRNDGVSNNVECTTTERIVKQVWADLLKRDVIEIEDNFFALGGNSFLLIRLKSAIQMHFALKNVNMGLLLRYSTVRKLAAYLDSKIKINALIAVDECKEINQQLSLQPQVLYYQYPLSLSQKRMYFLNILHQNDNTDLFGHFSCITPPIMNNNLTSLRLQTICTRSKVLTAILPTAFTSDPKQSPESACNSLTVIYPSLDFCIAHPFAHQKLLYMRFSNLLQWPSEGTLSITINHICADALSVNLILKDLYEDPPVSRNVHETCGSYAEYALEDVSCAHLGKYDRHIAYWTEQFAKDEYTLSSMRHDKIKLHANASSYSQSSILFVAKLVESKKLTNFTAALLCFTMQLTVATGQNDICIPVVVNCRSKQVHESLIGCMINVVLPWLRPPCASMLGCSQYVAGIANEILEHRCAPYEMVLEKLRAKFQNNEGMFQDVLLNFLDSRNEGSDLQLNVNLKPGLTDYDLALTLQHYHKACHNGILTYNFAVLYEGTAKMFCIQFARICHDYLEGHTLDMHSLIKLPTTIVDMKYKIVDSETSDLYSAICQLRNTSNKFSYLRVKIQLATTDRNYFERSSSLVNARLEQQISRDHFEGCKNDNYICTYAERDFKLLHTFLGIMRAGHVYVPVDIDYPEERKAFILQDSLSRVWSTTPDDNLCCVSFSKWHAFPSRNNPQDLVYTIYTSGSTGIPKGVCISHSAFSITCHSITIVTKSLGGSSVMYQSASLVFDLSLADIGLLTHHCCTLILCLQPIAAGSEMTREPVTFATLATSTFNRCKNISKISKIAECLTSCGEIMNLKLANEMLQYGGKLFNFYGPTETTIYSSAKLMTLGVSARNIGSSLNNETFIVFNSAHPYFAAASNSPLFISGKTLSRGYLNASEKTLRCFRKIRVGQNTELAYATGDICNTSQSLELQFTGRKDFQIKLHGIRVELSEIENVLLMSVSRAIAVACIPVDSSLVAFVESPNDSIIQAMQSAAKRNLPAILQPQEYITLTQFPLGHTGKISRDKLIDIYWQSRKICQISRIEYDDDTFKGLYKIWQNMLGKCTIDPTSTFFALGGTSLSLFHMVREIEACMHTKLEIVDIMENPSLHSLTKFITSFRKRTLVSKHVNNDRRSARKDDENPTKIQASLVPQSIKQKIAITGWAGQFSASTSAKTFLNNLYDSVDCISHTTEYQSRSETCKQSEVYAIGKLEDSLAFDPDFWKMTHAEAGMLDPQARKFLEQCYHALELNSSVKYASCGVFAGCGMNTYLQHIDDSLLTATERWNFTQLNTAFQFSTRVAFMLNLQGPAMSIDTACSTSIVALKEAMDSIENKHCSAALVGAASFLMPAVNSYRFEEGMILSKDGYCRVFDSDAGGTVQGAGCAAILIEQLPSGHSLGIVESVSVNNDGSDKMAYTAPSVNGQVKCLTQALDRANIANNALSYVECHGTGTQLGDAIELTALEQVFKDTERESRPLIIGSVKANIGHADKAAGMAGIIKAIEIPFRSAIPPQIHIQNLNRILSNSKCLSITTTNQSHGLLFRSSTYIGISSFGIGGTNAHCILSKNACYQPLTADNISDNCALPYIFSGNSILSCSGNQANFASFIQNDQQVPLCMAAGCLVQLKHFKFRTAFYTQGREYLIQELQKHTKPVAVLKPDFSSSASMSNGRRTCSFLYPGQGNIYPNSGKLSYDTHESYRFSINTCVSDVCNVTGVNIWPLIFPVAASIQHELLLARSEWAQLVTFILCYAVKRQLDEWDIKAEAFVGHSFGEYCGYHLHSDMNIVESIKTIYDRGRILQAQADWQSGRMIISNLQMLDYLNTEYTDADKNDNSLSIATVGLKSLTISGNRKDVQQLCQRVSGKLPVKLLKTSHAFHSCLLEPGLSQIIESQYSIKYAILNIPFSSNINGTQFGMTRELYANAQYWSAQLRNTVYIGNCIKTLAENSSSMIEIGPGHSLLHYVHETNVGIHATSTLGKTSEPAISLGQAVCNTWKLVGNVDIKKLIANPHQYTPAVFRHFPVYHFEKVNCFINTKFIKNEATGEICPHVQQWEMIRNVYASTTTSSMSTLTCVAFLGDSIMGIKILRHLCGSLNIIVIVKLAKRYRNRSHLNSRFVIDLDPYSKNGYTRLNNWLTRNELYPDVIIHGWLLERQNQSQLKKHPQEWLNYFLYLGCYSIYFLQHTHLFKATKAVKLLILSNEIFPSILDVNPAKHAVVGLVRAMSSQMKWIDSICIDIGANPKGGKSEKYIVRELLKLISGSAIIVPSRTIAISNQRLWHIKWSSRNLADLTQKTQHNVSSVCITGGLGRIALSVANGLSQKGAKWFLLAARNLNVQTESYISNCSAISSLAQLCVSDNVKLSVLMCDVVTLKDVKKLVSTIKSQVQCLDLLIHTASNAVLTTLDHKEIVDVAATIQPKLHGSVFLINEVEIQRLPVKTFAMTSSMVVLLPTVAASEYTAANTAMDSLIYRTELNYIAKLITMNLHMWEPSQQWSVKSKQQNRSPMQGSFMKAMVKHAVDDVTSRKLFIEALNLRESVQQIIFSHSPLLSKNILTAQETESGLVKTSSIHADSSVVRSVFADVLGKNSFTDDESFFELGGNSFSALMLIAQLKRFTECSINVNSLIQLDTVAKMVTYIQTANEYHKMGGKSLVPFEMPHDNNQQYTLIYLHPVGGCLFQTDALSKQICRLKTYSSYGIQFPYAFSNEMPTTITSLEHLVQTYADEILQDIGEDLNFVFIGHSLGGTLAYELASQLSNRQKSCTSCIIMFDTWAKYTDYKYDEAKFQKFQHKNIQDRLLKDHPSLDDALIWSIAKPIVKTSSFLMKLLLQYSPAKSELLVHQFKANELDELHSIEQVDNDGYGSNYWEMVTPNVTVHAAQGDHQTMLDDEYVETIANQIIEILNDL